jgi:hypothetical protein
LRFHARCRDSERHRDQSDSQARLKKELERQRFAFLLAVQQQAKALRDAAKVRAACGAMRV